MESIESKKAALAEHYFLSGCNCSQSVVCAFLEETGLDYDTAMKLGSSFGGGFGRLREVCGAFSGACIVAGLLWGYSDTTDKSLKTNHYAKVQEMAARFREKHGTLICREMLRGIESSTDFTPSDRTEEYYKKRPCPKIAAYAAEIVEDMIAQYGFTTVALLPLNTAKDYRFVVIFARQEGKWLYARAKTRDTWETAGGHIENGETPRDAACRELWEETGAVDYDIRPLFDYSVRVPGDFAYGQVFLADVHTRGDLPDAFEMAEVQTFDTYPDAMRFPAILPVLYQKVTQML